MESQIDQSILTGRRKEIEKGKREENHKTHVAL